MPHKAKEVMWDRSWGKANFKKEKGVCVCVGGRGLTQNAVLLNILFTEKYYQSRLSLDSISL